MVGGGSGWLDRGWKDDGLQVLHSSDGPLLAYFSVMGGSSGEGSRLGFF